MDLYPWLKWLHILLAIVAVGFNVSYAVWQARAAREPEHMGWALRGIKFLDDRIANPAYGGLLAVGVILVLIGPWEFTDFWVYAALALYALLAVIAFTVYSPTLTKSIAAFDADGASSAEFQRLATRTQQVGGLLGVLVVILVGLMVLKPGS